MCVWNVKSEDRLCQFCSFRGGCESYPAQRYRFHMAESDADFYIDTMSGMMGFDIMRPSREPMFVWSRYIVLYTLRTDGHSLMSIEKATGINHSTVVHACRKVEEMLLRPRMYPVEKKMWDNFNERLLSLQKK